MPDRYRRKAEALPFHPISLFLYPLAILLTVWPVPSGLAERATFLGALLIGGVAGLLSYRKTSASRPRERYQVLSAVFLFTAALFSTADLRLFGGGAPVTIGLFLMLALGGYFGWRAGETPSPK